LGRLALHFELGFALNLFRSQDISKAPLPALSIPRLQLRAVLFLRNQLLLTLALSLLLALLLEALRSGNSAEVARHLLHSQGFKTGSFQILRGVRLESGLDEHVVVTRRDDRLEFADLIELHLKRVDLLRRLVLEVRGLHLSSHGRLGAVSDELVRPLRRLCDVQTVRPLHLVALLRRAGLHEGAGWQGGLEEEVTLVVSAATLVDLRTLLVEFVFLVFILLLIVEALLLLYVRLQVVQLSLRLL